MKNAHVGPVKSRWEMSAYSRSRYTYLSLNVGALFVFNQFRGESDGIIDTNVL